MDINLYQLFLGFGSLFGVVMTTVLYILYRTYPASILGLRDWCLGSLSWSAAALIYVGRGEFTPLVTVVVANVLVLTGPCFFYLGLLKFINQYKTRSIWAVICLIISVAAALAWFLYVNPDYKTRGLVLISSVLLMDFLILKLMFTHFPNTLGKFFVLAVVSTMFTGWLIRGINVFLGNIPENFQNSDSAQVMLFALTPIIIPMITLACVLLASEKLRHELEIKSRFDTLTKALSRGAIIEEIDKEVTRSARNHSVFSLLVLDLDGFKQINDTLGHQHGDYVLISFASVVTNLLRQIDFFGRMGGDEFIILLPGADLEAAEAVVNRIQAENFKDTEYKWAVSVGVTCWQGPQDNTDSMIARADQELYRAKRLKI